MNRTYNTSTAPVPGPARRALLTREYVQAVGRMADIWRWPLADRGQRKIACCQPPVALPRRTGDVSLDQHEVAGPQQGLADGLDVSLLDMEQVTAQVQDVGDRFWIFPLYDRSPLGHSANASGRAHGRL